MDGGGQQVAVPGLVGGSRGAGGSTGSLPLGVMEEPHPSCLFVASATVTDATRYSTVQNLSVMLSLIISS